VKHSRRRKLDSDWTANRLRMRWWVTRSAETREPTSTVICPKWETLSKRIVFHPITFLHPAGLPGKHSLAAGVGGGWLVVGLPRLVGVPFGHLLGDSDRKKQEVAPFRGSGPRGSGFPRDRRVEIRPVRLIWKSHLNEPGPNEVKKHRILLAETELNVNKRAGSSPASPIVILANEPTPFCRRIIRVFPRHLIAAFYCRHPLRVLSHPSSPTPSRPPSAPQPMPSTHWHLLQPAREPRLLTLQAPAPPFPKLHAAAPTTPDSARNWPAPSSTASTSSKSRPLLDQNKASHRFCLGRERRS
jgi:hypothetical protein